MCAGVGAAGQAALGGDSRPTLQAVRRAHNKHPAKRIYLQHAIKRANSHAVRHANARFPLWRLALRSSLTLIPSSHLWNEWPQLNATQARSGEKGSAQMGHSSGTARPLSASTPFSSRQRWKLSAVRP